MNNYLVCPEFPAGTSAISIVNHPPEIHPGMPVTIVNPWIDPSLVCIL